MKKINILVPDLPESINDATVIKWHKKIGDTVTSDDNIVDIETDKVMLEISSPCNGILNSILEKEGNIVKPQQILGQIKNISVIKDKISNHFFPEKSNFLLEKKENLTLKNEKTKVTFEKINKYVTPSIRRLIKINQKNDFSDKFIKKDNKINSLNNIEEIKETLNTNISNQNTFNKEENKKFEKRIKMSRLRQKISERLLYSKNNTAMLTTFNEVNMQPIILLRKKYSEIFEKEHGIRIGYMSFFVKAVVQALKKFPEINASIDGNDIIYYKNFDISIAISTPRGLITPVLRNAEIMTIPEIEKQIKEFSIKGSQNKIDIKELIGGNFTITNGGVFGSLMSTPIINPPQTAILGMHAIQDRVMVINGEIKILPMMYLALSYDHRLIDGKESVSFLVTIKNTLEDFNRILIDI
ncbi:MAG: dihydrolipoyllysine-residue succinyltransferase [Buchnera aphidicola (Brevicoryne brassicae)]|uniref:Dihydrolipoyllysine-residue succinyltransferase n=1 Tax=Buchnera aphidicola (Brevicoryne brassicae) TaxID=911343 RepID=A0AAJ5PV79_9GAMM|nr:dihydrolipoyllysine-residue succinyltransferase [Buchnera aphidicola]QCI19866.1 dihydrolipoyllysine-residue succinyltransferase [Buchnera aphidicola (Brevicoryne brassicae)]WAI18688.1 MAG: dihydrolipoyllysine-residue succinyltransferase [Buchnera aphidicola (Brevicoryne brassicae)]